MQNQASVNEALLKLLKKTSTIGEDRRQPIKALRIEKPCVTTSPSPSANVPFRLSNG
ncbi:hypothetical protein EMIT0P201_12419 [Pseudomonas chlororaphis]